MQARKPAWGKGYYGDIELEDPAQAAGRQGGPEGEWQDGEGSTHGRPAPEAFKRELAGAPPASEDDGQFHGNTPPWGRGYYGDLELQDRGQAAGWQGGPEGGWQDGSGSTHGRPATETQKREIADAPRARPERDLRAAS